MSDAQPSSSSRSRHLIRLLVILALLGASMWYALKGVEWHRLWQTVLSVDLWWVGAAVASTLLAHVIRGHRWRLLIPNGLSIPLLDVVSATMIGYMMNNIIPRSGELARPYVLARREGRSMSSLVATVVVERILDGVMLALLFALLLVLERERLEQILHQSGSNSSATGIVIALGVPIVALIVILVVAVRTTLGDRFLDWLSGRLPERLVGKLRFLLHEFRAGIAFGGRGGLVRIPFWTLAIWLGYALSMYFGFRAFGFDTAYGMGLWEMVPMLAITSVAITIAPTPGAFGFYHAVCKAALVTLYSVPDDSAVAFALVMHAAPYLSVIIAGALFSMRESISIGDTLRQVQQPVEVSTESAVDTPR